MIGLAAAHHDESLVAFTVVLVAILVGLGAAVKLCGWAMMLPFRRTHTLNGERRSRRHPSLGNLR